ncbi:MAG: DUF441 domain-containing protein [Thermaerobacterales bacterium]
MISQGIWVLYLVLAAGVIGRNRLVIAAAAVLITVTTLRLELLVVHLERHSVNIGLTFMIIGLLAPFASGRLTLKHVIKGLRGAPGLMAVAGGALSAYMSSQGLALLALEPEVIIGLVAGTLIGVAVLGGIPVGPLAAAGITAVLLQVVHWLQ